HAGKDEHGGKDHHGSVVLHQLHVAHELLYSQPDSDPAAGEAAEHAPASEEVQRAREITQQEAYGHEVEEHAEGPRDAVVRLARRHDVLDGDLADGRAVP